MPNTAISTACLTETRQLSTGIPFHGERGRTLTFTALRRPSISASEAPGRRQIRMFAVFCRVHGYAGT